MAVAFLPGERPRPEWLRQHPGAWVAAVATVCFGAFMGQLDASIVALTYRPIGAHFGAGLGVVQWVSLGYLLTLGGLLVPVGRASDRLGRKRVYLWGFVLFTVASLGCALAPSLAALVSLRVLQGAGAAMLQANSIALVATSAPAPRLRLALGVQAAAQALGLALGPTLGGLVVQTIGWRWVFALNVPVGVVAIVAGRYLLPRTRLPEGEPPGRLREVVRVPGMLSGATGAMLTYALLFGPIVLVPTVLQAHGMSALGAGLVTAAQPAGFALAAATGERLLPGRWTAAARCLAGLAVAAAGLGVLLLAGPHAGWCAAALAVTGAGLGLFAPANNAAIMAATPQRAAGIAGGLVNTARAGGTAVGVAVVAATVGTLANGRLPILIMLGLAALAVPTLRRLGSST